MFHLFSLPFRLIRKMASVIILSAYTVGFRNNSCLEAICQKKKKIKLGDRWWDIIYNVGGWLDSNFIFFLENNLTSFLHRCFSSGSYSK
jgi:hypothetical protein